MSLRAIMENVPATSINEGTTAAIIVKQSNGKFSMAYAQYDGYLDGVGAELIDNFYSQEGANQLVDERESGEIRGIDNGEVEFYSVSDRKGKAILITNASDKKVIKEAKSFGSYIYYWDGQDWYYADSGYKSNVKSVEDIDLILDGD